MVAVVSVVAGLLCVVAVVSVVAGLLCVVSVVSVLWCCYVFLSRSLPSLVVLGLVVVAGCSGMVVGSVGSVLVGRSCRVPPGSSPAAVPLVFGMWSAIRPRMAPSSVTVVLVVAVAVVVPWLSLV